SPRVMQQVQESPRVCHRALELDLLQLPVDLVRQRLDRGPELATSRTVGCQRGSRAVARKRQYLLDVLIDTLASQTPPGDGRPHFCRVHTHLGISFRFPGTYRSDLLGDQGIQPMLRKERERNAEFE